MARRPKAYRIRQVAELLNCPTSTVYDMVRTGALASVRTGKGRGGVVLVPAAAVETVSGAEEAPRVIEHAVTAGRSRECGDSREGPKMRHGILCLSTSIFGTSRVAGSAELAGTTKKQARDLLTQRLGEVRAGTYVNPKDVDRERGPTVKEFAKTFLRDHPGQPALRPLPRHA